MNSVATEQERLTLMLATEFISDIRTGTTYLNVITEFISDNRTGTTYRNAAPEFISDIRTGTTPVLISEMNSDATLG
jgi:hypothetical protein